MFQQEGTRYLSWFLPSELLNAVYSKESCDVFGLVLNFWKKSWKPAFAEVRGKDFGGVRGALKGSTEIHGAMLLLNSVGLKSYQMPYRSSIYWVNRDHLNKRHVQKVQLIISLKCIWKMQIT